MPDILVVDDERTITDLVEVYLQNENFRVFKYYNGKDALECVNTRPLDLAILDIMLPDIHRRADGGSTPGILPASRCHCRIWRA